MKFTVNIPMLVGQILVAVAVYHLFGGWACVLAIGIVEVIEGAVKRIGG
jgi:hypothetical protein